MKYLTVPMLLWALTVTTYGQTAIHATPKEVTSNVTNPAVSLYMFMRAIAVSDNDDQFDKARRDAMIRHIGLNSHDTQVVRNQALVFADSLRQADQISDPAARQRMKMGSFADVIHHLRAEMSSEGLNTMREHLTVKQKGMRYYQKGEGK